MWNRKINFKKRICCLIRSALQDHKSYFHHWLTETINICMNIEKNMVFILTEWSDINVPGNDIIWMLIAIVLTCRTLLRIKVMQIHMKKNSPFQNKMYFQRKKNIFFYIPLVSFPMISLLIYTFRIHCTSPSRFFDSQCFCAEECIYIFVCKM